MHSSTHAVPVSKERHLAGPIVSAIPVLFLAFDTAIKFTTMEPVVESFRQFPAPRCLARSC